MPLGDEVVVQQGRGYALSAFRKRAAGARAAAAAAAAAAAWQWCRAREREQGRVLQGQAPARGRGRQRAMRSGYAASAMQRCAAGRGISIPHESAQELVKR